LLKRFPRPLAAIGREIRNGGKERGKVKKKVKYQVLDIGEGGK